MSCRGRLVASAVPLFSGAGALLSLAVASTWGPANQAACRTTLAIILVFHIAESLVYAEWYFRACGPAPSRVTDEWSRPVLTAAGVCATGAAFGTLLAMVLFKAQGMEGTVDLFVALGMAMPGGIEGLVLGLLYHAWQRARLYAEPTVGPKTEDTQLVCDDDKRT
ncbi:MAG: hypothetical protein HZB16_21135 [Armatimonadetes bacterium]|nr:hypothetical protein [Armatimonadota bacterium]